MGRPTMNSRLLVAALRDPASVDALTPDQWNALIAMARAERLIGTLAVLVVDRVLPDAVRPIVADALTEAEREARQALWEADRARVALAALDVPVILLKGTAYAAASLTAGQGRFIGDLDILVPRDALDVVEAALFAAGWEWVKPDPYDDAYYRQWMHELPPMIHATRDRMIDVHHTILPLTAKPKPWPYLLIDQSVPLPDGLRVLSPEHMVIHAAAHLFADGDLAGGLRNLWDIHCLCSEFGAKQDDFYLSLIEEAGVHGLIAPVQRALTLARHLYGTATPTLNMRHDVPRRRPGSSSHGEDSTPACAGERQIYSDASVSMRPVMKPSDHLFIARLLARDGWGRETRKALRFAFFLRSHWLRMPPLMLARHLWTKWRKGHRPA